MTIILACRLGNPGRSLSTALAPRKHDSQIGHGRGLRVADELRGQRHHALRGLDDAAVDEALEAVAHGPLHLAGDAAGQRLANLQAEGPGLVLRHGDADVNIETILWVRGCARDRRGACQSGVAARCHNVRLPIPGLSWSIPGQIGPNLVEVGPSVW